MTILPSLAFSLSRSLALPALTWLTPWIGGIAAAIAIPTLILLYFLKLRRRPVAISSTLLWRKAIEDLQANAPFQKLRRNILLLLQLLVLAALLTALAQPEIADTTQVNARHVILIDRSASMRTREDGDARLDLAKQRALELVDNLQEGGIFGTREPHEAMVIAFDRSAEVLTPFTSDKSALRRIIRSIEPTSAPSGLEQAMRLARAHAERVRVEGQTVEGLRKGVGTIHIVSDGRLPDAPQVLPGVEDEVIYHAIGKPGPVNLGITTLRAERAYDDPRQLSIFVGLHSTATSERIVDLEMQIGGELRVYPVRVAPMTTEQTPAAADDTEAAPQDAIPASTPGTGSTLIELDLPEAALIAFRLRGEAVSDDALDADDQAWIVVPPARRLAVALVTPGNPFLADWLGRLRFSRYEAMTPDAWRAARQSGAATEFDVVILDRTLPADPDAEDAMPPGRYLVLGAVPPVGVSARGTQQMTQFVDWQRNHPALPATGLDNIRIAEQPVLELADDAPATILAESDAGPVILEAIAPEARAIIVAFDPLQSTWPFDVSYPVFIASAINALGNEAAAGGAARALRPGDILTDRVPAGVQNPRLITPDHRGQPAGRALALTPAADGRIVYGPLDRIGVYELRYRGAAAPGDVRRDGDTASRFYASNLLDPAETDIVPAASLELASRTLAAAGTESDTRRRLWPWLVLAALAVVMLEWWVYNRKVHV